MGNDYVNEGECNVAEPQKEMINAKGEIDIIRVKVGKGSGSVKKTSVYLGLISIGLVPLYVLCFFSLIDAIFFISILLLMVSECLSIFGLFLTIKELKKEGAKRHTIVAILTNGVAFLVGSLIFAAFFYLMILAIQIDPSQFDDFLG